jgi:rod shape determining protein RodA
MIGPRTIRRLDWTLLFAVFALLVFTWPYMKSASWYTGPGGEGYYTSGPDRQIAWVVLGCIAALVLLNVSYRTMAESSTLLYLFGLALLVLVAVRGRRINGAKSWLEITSMVRFQPSEVVKITTIIALGHYLSRESEIRRFGHVLGALALAAVPSVMIAAQPDLGTALMFVPAAVAMVFVAGARLRHLALLAAVTIVMLPVLWLGMSPHQRVRVTTWLNQGRPLTRAERVGRFHHLIQSKVAIGAGGWTGRGRGQGTQNRLNFLGFRNTDFVFAVICEEAGFLGASIVIGLYILLGASGLSIAARCRDRTGRLIAVGVTTLFVFQGFVNIGMTTGLLPIVGVTLPFVSYGGSSTLASFIGVSLLLNVGLRRTRITFSREELGLAMSR